MLAAAVRAPEWIEKMIRARAGARCALRVPAALFFLRAFFSLVAFVDLYLISSASLARLLEPASKPTAAATTTTTTTTTLSDNHRQDCAAQARRGATLRF